MWKFSHSLCIFSMYNTWQGFICLKSVYFKTTGNCLWVCHQGSCYCGVWKESHMRVFTCVLDWMELGTVELFVCNRWSENASCKLRKCASCEYIWMITPMQCHKSGSPHMGGVQWCICPSCIVSISLVSFESLLHYIKRGDMFWY